MALALMDYAGNGSLTATLGDLGTTGLSATDHADLTGRASGKVMFVFDNADAAESLAVALEGSADGVGFGTFAYAVDPSTGSDVTSFTAAADGTSVLMVEPWRVPRFVRVTTTDTNNTSATTVSIYAECH